MILSYKNIRERNIRERSRISFVVYFFLNLCFSFFFFFPLPIQLSAMIAPMTGVK
jgi:hypothetical protein